jgi:predicted acylesterase/phospholipase RssA
MIKPFRFQLALQGGGAKIVHLIAALEAIELLKGEIEVTRIVGTSAGAIAGALYAAGIPMSTVKSELRAFGKDLERSPNVFPKPGKAGFFWTVVMLGNAIADKSSLSKLLKRIFASAGVESVGDIVDKKKGPPIRIVYADLYSGTAQLAKDADPMVTALLDSCAIPFYFRVWNDPRGAFVDGGICENLAVAKLRENQDKFGPIVAVSFNRSPLGDPKSFLDYAKALLDTAIHNSVNRALQDLAPEHVLPITTDLETFDFKRALGEEGLGSIYNATHLQATQFFENFLKAPDNHSVPVKDLWTGQNPETMRKLWSLYRTNFSGVKYNIDHAAYIVQANCLVESGQPLSGQPDQATYRLTLHTSEEPVHAQKFSLMISPGSDFLGLAELQVFGPAEYLFESTTLLPVSRPEVPEAAKNFEKGVVRDNVRELVCFFSPPLPPRTGPFLLVFKEFLRNSAEKLKVGQDRLWISALPRASGPVKRMDLVLLVPEAFGPVSMRPEKGAKNVGSLLGGTELDEYKKLAPLGFYPIAWTVYNADPKEPFSVRIDRGAPSSDG